MDEQLDAAPIIFDPNSLLTTNHMLFLFSCWASMLPDPSPPVEIFSQFKVTSISHNKILESPQHEFLVIETVDPSEKSYQFVLERRSSERRTITPAVEPGNYRTRLMDKLKKLVNTLTSILVPNDSSSTFNFDSLSIGDKTSVSLVQSADLMTHVIDKSDDTPAVDRFLGQNYLRSPHYHGQIVAYFKPDKLTIFEVILLAHVVHEMHPTYTLLGEQCYFYTRIIYAATQQIFGVSPSKSANENEDLVYFIDSHLTTPVKYGRWKGILINIVDEDAVSKVKDAYAVTYSDQIAKVFFIYL